MYTPMMKIANHLRLYAPRSVHPHEGDAVSVHTKTHQSVALPLRVAMMGDAVSVHIKTYLAFALS